MARCFRRLPGLRFAAAALILGAALASAVILHGLRERQPSRDQYLSSVNVLTKVPPSAEVIYAPTPPSRKVLFVLSHRRPSWADPLALAICILGIAGAGLLVVGRRRTA